MYEIDEILFNERDIAARIGELAEQISKDYTATDLIIVCILKGAALFTADLVRHLTIPVTVAFIQAASYGSSDRSSRTIRIIKDLDTNITGKQVLLMDTIIDTGKTLDALISMFKEHAPASIKTVALLDKRSRREVDVPVAYRGFEIEDTFVVGYGMDYGERYRNLPYIASLKRIHE